MLFGLEYFLPLLPHYGREGFCVKYILVEIPVAFCYHISKAAT